MLGRHVDVELRDGVVVHEAVVADVLRVAHLPVRHLDVVAGVRDAEARDRLPADPLQEAVGALIIKYSLSLSLYVYIYIYIYI